MRSSLSFFRKVLLGGARRSCCLVDDGEVNAIDPECSCVASPFSAVKYSAGLVSFLFSWPDSALLKQA